jgi:hypothetical protein
MWVVLGGDCGDLKKNLEKFASLNNVGKEEG